MNEGSFENAPKINEKIVKKSTFNVLIITIIIITGIATFFAGSYLTNFNSDKISQEELDNAIAKLELKILEKQLPKNQPTLPLKISAGDNPIIGNPDAAITIIEFSDFQCPFCAKFHTETLPTIMEEYINKGTVKLVFRDFPIQNIHPNAVPASIAAECANEQGKFKQMYHTLFEKQKEWSNLETSYAITIFNQYASEMELDEEKFDSCLRNAKYLEDVQNDLNDGRTYGVTGTPGFFIGNEKIGFVELKGSQPFESFKKIIDSQLKN